MNYINQQLTLDQRMNMMSDQDILDFAEEKDLEYFDALSDVAKGYSTGVICIGPPGVGKTFDSEQVLAQQGVTHVDFLNSDWERVDDGKGPVEWECTRLETGAGPLTRASDYSNWALHADLYANRNGVLLIDDNDQIMKDTAGLSIMMKATEHKDSRPVDFTRAQFNTELSKYGVPAKFDYQGGLVILSNFKMKDMVQAKYGSVSAKPFVTRWAALLDRMEYVDMEMDHPRAVRVYVEHKIRKTDMYLNPNGYIAKRFGRALNSIEQEQMLEWVRKNQFNFQLPLSLRTTNEIAALIVRTGGVETEWKIKAARKLCKSI